MKAKRLITLVLFAAMLLSACGGSGSSDTTSADTTAAENTASASAEYEFTREYAGTEFHVLNAGDIYSMHAQIDREETNGEPLNDAMYERCRTLEDKMGITFLETNKGVDSELAKEAQKVVFAGEDIYDAIFMPARDLYTFSTQDALYDLLDYDELQLDQPWWIQAYNDGNVTAGSLYSAAGYAQLMVVDSIWCLYFNEDMMDDLKLEYPYQLVRDGKWTIDELNRYISAAANLNGDDSFDFTNDSKCIYGISTEGANLFTFGFGVAEVQSKDGVLTMTAGTERYYGCVSKLASVLTESDGHVKFKMSGDDDARGSYINLFESEQALFLTAELSKTNRMRSKEYSFGIVPFPKYDEAQEAYYSRPFYGTPGFSIPVTVTDPERVAAIGDALTYLSYDMVLPIFREVTLEQKNLRNDDSIEMLDIIMKSVNPYLTRMFTSSHSLVKAVTAEIQKGSDSVASIVASYKEAIQTELDALNNG